MDYDKRERDVLYQESPSHSGEEVSWLTLSFNRYLCLSHQLFYEIMYSYIKRFLHKTFNMRKTNNNKRAAIACTCLLSDISGFYFSTQRNGFGLIFTMLMSIITTIDSRW